MDVKVWLFSKEMSSYSDKEGWRRWQDRPLQSRAFMGTGGQRGRYHESCSNHCIPEWAMRYAKIFQLLSIVTWLLWYWNNGSNRLELKGREAKQLAMEGGNDKAIGKVAQSFTIWRWLLSGVKESHPFKEDVVCHPGKCTTTERGIQYPSELGMLEVIYDDLDDKQISQDPGEVKCTWPTWQEFVWSAPSSYTNSLAVMTWKDWEEFTVDELPNELRQYEESLSSYTQTCVSALEKLFQEVQQLKESALEKLSREVKEHIPSSPTCTTQCLHY